MLQSLERVPSKQLRGKALKLMQVQLKPGAGGFGIDLSEFNGVAGLVEGGAAEASDLRPGDVIIGADGVNIGSKRLIEVLQRGKKAYIFTVVRPTIMAACDNPFNLEAAPLATTRTAPTRSISDPPSARQPELPVTTAAEASNSTQDNIGSGKLVADLKKTLAESLGRLQTETQLLSGPKVSVVSVKAVESGGTAITIL